ncbi:MAG TPA: Mrp/NBP35 family ATP-binding protein [Phycisphaerae bacterium]|jgi:ATP-binding protein involved in chromosome partitioning|nr:Mrp/NBP35 family ATP-binding protein [Phycisphaerae bacterium]
MPVTEQDVLESLRSVQDPEVFRDIVTLNQVRNIKVCEGYISVELVSPSPSREKLRHDINAALARLPGVEEVFVNFAAPIAARPAASPGAHSHAATPHRHGPAEPAAPRGIPGVRHIVAVGAGKGGVGKSTVAVNLALALALSGKKVAILDGDIYGPSIPTLTGIEPQAPNVVADRIIPFTISSPEFPGISLAVMSIGFMVDREKALIWRGPMAHGAMKQMLEQVDWTGAAAPAQTPTLAPPGIDYLIVDLPPGTGDVSLTLAQTVPLTGAVIVATPQEVALADARRAVRMFQQLSVEILGVVENMSHFICDHGTEYDIFGRGGAQTMAQQMGLPFLGELPIHTSLRQNSDAGTPFANFSEKSPSRKPLLAMGDLLDKQVAVRMATRPAAKPINLQIS